MGAQNFNFATKFSPKWGGFSHKFGILDESFMDKMKIFRQPRIWRGQLPSPPAPTPVVEYVKCYAVVVFERYLL